MRTLWALPLFWYLLAALVANDSLAFPPRIAVFGFSASALLVVVGSFAALRFWRPRSPAHPTDESDVWVSFPEVPPELDRWNWGAFFYAPAWAIGNRVWWGVLAGLPYVAIPVAIYLGLRGNRLSWKTTEWESVHEFVEAQRTWGRWATGAFMGAVVAFLLIPFFAALAV